MLKLKYVLILMLIAGSLPAQRQPRIRPETGSLTTYSTQIVPLVIVGEGWGQRIVLTNVDDANPAVGTIQFYTQSGAIWSVSTAAGRNSIFAFSLQPGQTYLLDTLVSQAPQTLGWAMIQETHRASATFSDRRFSESRRRAYPTSCVR